MRINNIVTSCSCPL